MRTVTLRCLVVLAVAIPVARPCFCDSDTPQTVLAIDIETASVRQTAEIDSLYSGDADYVYAFLVIQQIAGGHVSGYDLGFELSSTDSSVVNMGFRRLPGWSYLDPNRLDVPSDISLPGKVAPVAIGFWKLWLGNGSASEAELSLTPNWKNSSLRITLLDSEGNRITPDAVYSGRIIPLPPDGPLRPEEREIRVDFLGRPIPEVRSDDYEPGEVIAKFKPGSVNIPDVNTPSTISSIADPVIKGVAARFGLAGIRHLYRNAVRGKRQVLSRTGEVVTLRDIWDIYLLSFPEDADVWTVCRQSNLDT
jgi:hypothetical protein